jgi:hypothetical protein
MIHAQYISSKLPPGNANLEAICASPVNWLLRCIAGSSAAQNISDERRCVIPSRPSVSRNLEGVKIFPLSVELRSSFVESFSEPASGVTLLQNSVLENRVRSLLSLRAYNLRGGGYVGFGCLRPSKSQSKAVELVADY